MSDVDIAITVERDQSLDETILAAVNEAGFVVDRAMPKLRTSMSMARPKGWKA